MGRARQITHSAWVIDAMHGVQLPKFVRLFTNALEWRCLDRIRAPIQELCVANLPD